MNERDLTRELESWLAEQAPALDDRTLYRTIAQIPSVPQRRRWWPFRWFPFGIGATRSASPSGPRPERRSTSMFTATRVAAGIAVVALTGSLAFAAGWSDSTNVVPVPAAVTEEPEATPDGIHVSGTIKYHLASVPPPDVGRTTDGPDGSSLYRDAWFKTTWESDDPRFVGTGEQTSNSNTYPSDTAEGVAVGWGTQFMENDEGSWTARGSDFGVVIGDVEESVIPVWFDGAGAYEDMSALLIQTDREMANGHYEWDFEGWVVPGDAHLEDLLE